MDVLIYFILFIFLKIIGHNNSEFGETDIVRNNLSAANIEDDRERSKISERFRTLCLTHTNDFQETENEIKQLKIDLKINNVFPNITSGREETFSNKTTRTRKLLFSSIYSKTIWEEYPGKLQHVQDVKHVNNSTLVKATSSGSQTGLEVLKRAIATSEELKADSVIDVRGKSVNETLRLLCEAGWYYFQNRCYWISGPSDLRDWQDASDSCRANHVSHLLELNSDEELAFVLSKISKSPDSVWVGASYSEQEKIFQWSHSKAPVQFDYWSIEVPSGVSGQDLCVFLTKWEPIKTLNSAYCGIIQRFVCEKMANHKTESVLRTTKF